MANEQRCLVHQVAVAGLPQRRCAGAMRDHAVIGVLERVLCSNRCACHISQFLMRNTASVYQVLKRRNFVLFNAR